MSRSLPGGWLESGHGAVVVFVKDFRDPLERRKKLVLRPWASIKDIKDQLQVVFNVPSNAQKLFYQGRELKNAHNLQQCGIYKDNAVIDFVARRPQTYVITDMHECSEDRGSNLSVSGGSRVKKSTPSCRVNNGKKMLNLKPEQIPVVNIQPYGAHLLPVTLMKITHQALQGLALGLAPVLAMDGTGGTYFFKDPSHRNVGCFKPEDEEPFGPNNPRGLVGQLGQVSFVLNALSSEVIMMVIRFLICIYIKCLIQSGLRRGILSGEACERELAAYLLDKVSTSLGMYRGLVFVMQPDHFAGVPATSLVEARHPVFNYTSSDGVLHFKKGSLQEFVRHDDVVSDMAPNLFSTHQVHKIVLLDMRLLNTDRNDANILVRKQRSPTTGRTDYELIPIDHGYCLPHFLEIGWCDWCWYNWPQLLKPLSTEDRAYVLSLSALTDADRLAKEIPLRSACRRNMIIASMVLQKGVRADLVLFEIARIICREDLDTYSTIERLCIEAFHQVLAVKQLKQNEGLFLHCQKHSTSTPVSTTSDPVVARDEQNAAPNDSPRAAFRKLRVSIEPSSPQEPLTLDHTLSTNGLKSPPGFWASHTPFTLEEENDDSHDLPVHATNNEGKMDSMLDKREKPRLSLTWNEMASCALSDAVQTVEIGHSGSSITSVKACTNGYKGSFQQHDTRSPMSSFISVDDDKEEFEILNETLDNNVQDENLFLSILSRLLDDEIESVKNSSSRDRSQSRLKTAEMRAGAQCQAKINKKNACVYSYASSVGS
ncbi:hypothetical protein PsorP6_005979 [Peronosclerospora sorghi]|uniref:Uncharacterized protein n=1 Tax=Peronosclerospora sorghi TaxID=230839 RepID=A0ACC0W467_9STRA|nr:hypothetical protein PsorP6_005979 [Peronosclerospora sorghi]